MPAVDKENFPKAIKWEDMILKKEKCVPGRRNSRVRGTEERQ